MFSGLQRNCRYSFICKDSFLIDFWGEPVKCSSISRTSPVNKDGWPELFQFNTLSVSQNLSIKCCIVDFVEKSQCRLGRFEIKFQMYL